jgi:hypothetical protein
MYLSSLNKILIVALITCGFLAVAIQPAVAGDTAPAAEKPHKKTREEKQFEKFTKDYDEQVALQKRFGDSYWLQGLKGQPVDLYVRFHVGTTPYVDRKKDFVAVEKQLMERWANKLSGQGFTVLPSYEERRKDPSKSMGDYMVCPFDIFIDIALVDDDINHNGYDKNDKNYFAVSMYIDRIVNNLALSGSIPVYRQENFCTASEEALNATTDKQIDNFVRDFYKAQAIASEVPVKHKH